MRHLCLIPEAGKSSVLSRVCREGQPVKAEVPVPSISGTSHMGVASVFAQNLGKSLGPAMRPQANQFLSLSHRLICEQWLD